MTKEAFATKAIALQDTLFRISFSLLPSRYDQEDAVQESMRIALQKLHTLRQEQFFSTWLIRILINECYGILRKKKREIPSEEMIACLPQGADTELIDALMKLDVKLRLPIVLNYVEGYTTREIAAMLHIPESTVKTRMSRGRKLLKLELEEGGLGYEGTI